MGIDERIENELERIAEPKQMPASAVGDIRRRKRARRVLRRAEFGALAVIVVAGTLGGTYALSRVFRVGRAGVAAAPLPSNGRIVFANVPGEGQGQQLYLVNPDGTGLTQLTDDRRALDVWPAWSPNGTKVAFVRNDAWGDRTVRLAVIDVATREIRVLTPPAMSVARPAWSPDGTKVAFDGFGEGVPSGIYVVNADGSDLQRITDDRFFAPDSPEWSPDGSTIAFTGNLQQNRFSWDVYLMNADGSDLRDITNTPDENSSELLIGWTPDGQSLLISRGPGTLGPDLPDQEETWLLVTPDGQQIRELRTGTTGSARYQSPALSPDGRYVIFDTASDGTQNVWFMDLETGELTQVTTTGGIMPAWQPVPLADTATPTPESSETPSMVESVTPPGDVVTDLAGVGRVCGVTSVSGRFLGTGPEQTLYVFEPEPEGGCAGPNETFQYLGVAGPDGTVVATSAKLTECLDMYPCYAFAAPDLDGDGVDEIAVATEHADSIFVSLYRILPAAHDATTFTIEPFVVAAPGDPGYLGEGLAQFPMSGSTGAPAGVSCTTFSGRPAIVQQQASGAGDGWDVHTTVLAIDGRTLTVVDTKDRNVSVQDPRDIPGIGIVDRFCGVPTN